MDKKISQLEQVGTPNKDDLLLTVVNVANTPMSKSIDYETLFNGISWTVNVSNNVTFTENFTVNGNTTLENVVSQNFRANNIVANTVAITQRTPSSNTDSVIRNSLFFDANYLYVTVSNNSIKRISLQNF